MTIAKKVWLGLALELLILVSIGVLSFLSTLELLETNRLVTRRYRVLEEVRRLHTLMTDVENGQRSYLLTGDAAFLQPYEEAIEEGKKAKEHLRGLIAGDARQEARLQDIERLIAARLKFAKLTIDVGQSKDPDKGLAAAIKLVKSRTGMDLTQQIRVKTGEMEEVETIELKTRQSAAEFSAWVTLTTIGVGTLLAFLFVTAVGYFTARAISRPIRRLLDGAELIGQGMLGHRVDVGANDEIGELARAFNRMTEKRQQVHEGIRTAASQITSASAEILAGTTQQATGAQEQAAAVTQTMTTVDEVSQTADQAAQRAKAVGESVQKTLQIGTSGRKVVEDSLDAMEAVKEKVEATAENILGLAEQAQAISDIIATVNDIAEQTNLQALNAAIEASRAGEHGRGFTVVAGEVKALADQSKKATGQVRQILGEIQKATNSAVISTEEVTRGVASAIKVGGQAGETIKTLAETLTDTARVVTQIAASIGQQATGMTQIHQAMKNIDQVAKQNTIATRQATKAAENLNTLGARLASLTAE
ncbi:MAG: methyl-accepting chemotaxis protein [Planctomycetes bacterium]|nr:methyl-accepting chemotaxis protein [Planctomycetota bacterium]